MELLPPPPVDRCDGCGERFGPDDTIAHLANLDPQPGEAPIVYVHYDRRDACLAAAAGPGPPVKVVDDDQVRQRLAGETERFLGAPPG